MFATILIVEDESGIRELIKDALVDSGFDVTMARNAQAAQASVNEQRPDLAIVDWMMPQISGIELVRQLRKNSVTQALPIIMLTARSTEDDTIRGLEAGADDYITKPFSTRELVTRVKAMLRRDAGHAETALLQAGPLTLNSDARLVRINGTTVDLGQTEFRLLQFFMSHPNRVYSRVQLLDNVWGMNHFVEERTVDVHILRLRKALRVHKVDNLIETVRGAGYRLQPE